jgi:nucleoside-diphosphate-sugar epimerase
MKTLIIGGSGLISTAITRQLIDRGDDITLYNRGKTPLRADGPMEVVNGDRTDFPRFERQIAELGHFDCVVDMVCFDPEEARSAIRAFRGRVGQYIFCSTVTVYNKAGDGYPLDEPAPRDRPVGAYAQKKSLCEDVFDEAYRQGDLALTILRPGPTYGEGRGLFNTFGLTTTYLDRIRKGKPIVVHGDGNALTVVCHAEDVARGFVGAIGNRATVGQTYNVTGEEWLTWNRYHEKVAEALGAPTPAMVHIPTDLLGKSAPNHTAFIVNDLHYVNIFDTAAAHRDLQFRYTIPFVDGVRRIVAWLDANGGISNSDDDPFDDQVIAAWQSLTAHFLARFEGMQA